MKNLNPDYLFYAIFFLLSIFIMWDLLLPGYVLNLDSIFTDKIYLSDIFQSVKNPPASSTPFKVVLFALNLVLPMWLVQKLVFLSILFLSGVFAYQLSTTNRAGKLMAGLIYMINPFIYVRFLAGHVLLLIGYAFFPLFVKKLMDFFEKPSPKSSIKITFLLTIISLIPHYIPIAFVIFMVFLLVNFFKKKDSMLIRYSIMIGVIYFLINFYWILPFLLNSNSPLQTFEKFIGAKDVFVFSSRPAYNLNVLFNLSSLHGFWRQGYDFAKFHIPFWYILYVVILFLTVHGFFILNRNKKYSTYARYLLVITVISLILATGLSHPIFSKLFNFLFEKLPFFKGFREPHKFLTLVCLVYSFFGGVGLGDFTEQFKNLKERKRILLAAFIILCLITPIIYSYTIFFGFNNQLEVVNYPETWYDLDEYLNSDDDEFNTLFLPWHLYMDFRFNQKQRIVNPAESFFTKPIIQADNIEVEDIHSQSLNPISKYIEFLLKNRRKCSNFGELVKPLNVKYVVLLKEVDWESYTFLLNQEDLELILENDDFIVFKNAHETSSIYETDTVIGRNDWDGLINGNLNFDLNPIKAEKRSQIKYVIAQEPTKKYLALTERFSSGWKYDNQKPFEYLGALNAFEASEENKIQYQEFTYYFMAYFISGTAILVVIIYMLGDIFIKLTHVIKKPRNKNKKIHYRYKPK